MMSCVQGCISPQSKTYLEIGATYREIRAAFDGYQIDHEGSLPPDIPALIAYCRAGKMDYPTLAQDSNWTRFIYVANVASNDPPRTPLILYLPRTWMETQGMVGFLGGEFAWYRRARIEAIAREPGIDIQDKFADEEAFAQFKRRVKVTSDLLTYPRP